MTGCLLAEKLGHFKVLETGSDVAAMEKERIAPDASGPGGYLAHRSVVLEAMAVPQRPDDPTGRARFVPSCHCHCALSATIEADSDLRPACRTPAEKGAAPPSAQQGPQCAPEHDSQRPPGPMHGALHGQERRDARAWLLGSLATRQLREEIELDGTSTPERVSEFAETTNESIAGSGHSYSLIGMSIQRERLP